MSQAGCLYEAAPTALIMTATTTASRPPSTALTGQLASPDHARQTAQPTAAKNQSKVSVNPVALEEWSKSPGSSPSTNGRATISTEATLLSSMIEFGKLPRAVVEIKVREAYLHCQKALLLMLLAPSRV